jgi:hypothetical protein
VTGGPGPAGGTIATDGYNVWVAWGPTAIYVTQAGSASQSSYVSVGLPVSAMAYVKGRLMVAVGASIYNITAAGALPTPLYTHPNPGFTWTAFAEGPGYIYCIGEVGGGHSVIYATQVQADGTALQVPKAAGSVPDGEAIYAAKGYEGFLAVGTNRGLHIGSLDSSGNVTMGALIPATTAVQAFASFDRFIYYGLTNYDGVSTGIGRADLSVFVAELAPATASDLMATGQGGISSIVSYGGGIVFCVEGLGVFAQSTQLVASGTLSSGSITFGLDDPKVALAMDVRHQPLHGTVTAALSVDGSAPVTLGTSSIQGSSEPLTTFAANQVSGVLMEMAITLTPAAGSLLGPTLNRARLRASPSPDRTMLYTVPLMFADGIDPSGHGDVHFDSLTEFDYLTELEVSGALTTFQMLGVSHTVKIEDSNFVIYRRSDSGFWSGTYTVQLKEYL